MTKQEIGQEIHRIRKKNGVSTYRIVKDGIGGNIINTIERSTGGYTIDKLIQYCDHIGAKILIVEK